MPASSDRRIDRATPLAGRAAKLAPIQNECLRIVAGAYKATPIASLESETFVCPIDLHLDSLVSRAIHRLKQSPIVTQIESACTAVRRGLRRQNQNIRRPIESVVHPTVMERDWEIAWKDAGDTPRTEAPLARAAPSFAIETKDAALRRWTQRWNRRKTGWGETHARPPEKTILQLHKRLLKSHSSAIVQMRTGKTGLRSFLHRRRVPGHDSPACSCGYHCETTKHVLIHCPDRGNREQLLANGRLDCEWLLNTPEGARKAARWWIGKDILNQNALARELEIYTARELCIE